MSYMALSRELLPVESLRIRWSGNQRAITSPRTESLVELGKIPEFAIVGFEICRQRCINCARNAKTFA